MGTVAVRAVLLVMVVRHGLGGGALHGDSGLRTVDGGVRRDEDAETARLLGVLVLVALGRSTPIVLSGRGRR